MMAEYEKDLRNTKDVYEDILHFKDGLNDDTVAWLTYQIAVINKELTRWDGSL